MVGAEFGKAHGIAFRLAEVVEADFSELKLLKATVKLSNGSVIEAFDIDALELAYSLKPSVVEGMRFKHAKLSWVIHNMIGHPVMQLLALFGCYRAAFWVHDVTVPKVKRPKVTPSLRLS